MKTTGLLVLGILLLFLFIDFSIGYDIDGPFTQKQQQSKPVIYPGEEITLSAQGLDTRGLTWAWLSTNETGTWQDFTGWWDLQWSYSKRICINHTNVEDDLTNFPVLIQIESTDFITHTQTYGDDFVFTDATNTTKYNHEIESYSATQGKLLAWVNIPLVSATQDTIFYLYYGNPSCQNQQNKEGTWNTGYLMVHHLTGLKYFNLKDSTSHHWNVLDVGGTPSYSQTGKIGGCVDFNPLGGGDFLQIPGFSLSPENSFTGSAWVRLEGSAGTNRAIFDGTSATGCSLLINDKNQGRAIGGYVQGSPASCNGTTLLQQSSWYYLCIRADASTNHLDFFLNGVKENHTAIEGTLLQSIQGLNLGTNTGTTGSYMDGKIDELRISDVARSDAWITTEYTMMTSPLTFLAIGPAQTPREATCYGSPIYLNQSTTWVWTNFTWQNPAIAQGTKVGWRITYRDSNGECDQTDNMTFSIYGTPPARPIIYLLDSPDIYTIGELYHFTAVTTDLDGDPVAFLFDWDDGNQSGWTDYVASGTPFTASHAWQREGTYEVKVKAKDNSGAESAWSVPLEILVIDPSLPLLVLTAPSFVIEGTVFEVTVTSADVPVDNALVSFEETTLFTNTTGKVTITAPLVDSTQTYPLIAQHEGYHAATMDITVLNDDETTSEKGWLYGWVADTSGVFLENVRVYVFLSGDTSTVLCTFTDAHGQYDIRVPIGTHRLTASKNGYDTTSQEGILVQKNDAVEVNILLQQNTTYLPELPDEEHRDIVEAVINAGIATEKIAGTLAVMPPNQDYSLTLYNDALSVAIVSINQSNVLFTVAATDIPGTIFLVRLSNQSDLEDIMVTVDHASLPQVGFSQIFDIDDSIAVYARVLVPSREQTTAYCLVYLPHFSEHEISITTIMKGVDAFGGLLAIFIYLGIALIAAVFLVIPIVAIERKRT